MSRNADTDLLPWIMGGLMSAMAVAVIVGNTLNKLHPAAIAPTAVPSVPVARVSIATPAPALNSASDPAIDRVAADGTAAGANAPSAASAGATNLDANTPGATTPGPSTADALNTPGVATPLGPVIMPTLVPPSARSELPPGQVWECVLNGQRTFSDSPCGDRPAIRQLSEVNTMAAVPAGRAPRYLPPGMNDSGGGSGYAPDSYAPEDSEEAATDSGSGVSYYSVGVAPYRYGGHGPMATLQPQRRGPQNPIHASHQPRAIARKSR